jgi:hypothetical protein
MARFALEAINDVLAPHGWHINTAFVERLNLTIRQHVAAIGRRVSPLCKGEDGLRQQLAVFHCYDNFCLPHASVHRPVPQPEPTHGSGSPKQWWPGTPAMAAGLTDHVWSYREYIWLPVHTDPVLRQQMEARITHLLTPAQHAPLGDNTRAKSPPAEAKEDKSDVVPKAA